MKLRLLVSALVSAHLLIACGGGGDASTTPVAGSTSLSGVASKGPLKKAVVTAYAVDANGAVGTTKLAEKVTGEQGEYTLDMGNYVGALQLVVTASADTTTADEATGQDVALPLDFILHANTVIAAATGAQVQNASITPYTELASNLAKDAGGLNAANIANANSIVFNLIGVDPVATTPLNAATGATDAQKRYALFNAAVSVLANSAPTTADATTQKCFTDAGSSTGKKIQCATQQIATAVTGTAGAQADGAVSKRLVGLAAALVGAAADTRINKTGTSITGNDSAAKSLAAIETDVTAGLAVTLKGGISAAERSDVALAKQFFSRLRSNAAALQNGPLETGITDGVKAFGDSLRNEAAAVSSETASVLRLADIAQALWTNFKINATTSNPNNVPIPGFTGGCTVFQGAFPTQFGGADGAAGLRYAGTSVTATGPGDAAWVGCSLNHGSFTNGGVQYRQTLLFNMSTGFPAAVPYLAVTRKRFNDAGTTYQQNLTPALGGTFGYVLNGAKLMGFSVSGDLPPSTRTDGTLLAARYPVNINGALTQLATGAFQAAFTSGRYGVVPVGAGTESLMIDISPTGTSVVVVPDDATNAAQVAQAKVSVDASIKTANGELSGSLLADGFAYKVSGNNLVPGRIRFTGSIAVAPLLGGISGTVAPLLTGTLEVTGGSKPVAAFDGGLSLPNRPPVSLSVSITQETPKTQTTAAAYTLSGRYVQDGITVQISGTQTATGTAVTFADSSGVSVSVSTSGSTAEVTVSGRQTALIDKAKKRINYRDGTFESLI